MPVNNVLEVARPIMLCFNIIKVGVPSVHMPGQFWDTVIYIRSLEMRPTKSANILVVSQSYD